MKKNNEITVKDVRIKTIAKNGIDYICITDIARQKNAREPKDVVKHWMRQKNTLEYLGLWERLYNPYFKGAEFDPLLSQAGSNSFTMSPSRWVELTGSIGIITKNGAGGGTFAQQDIAFKFANWISVEFELYLVKEFQRLKLKEQNQVGWTAKQWREANPNLNGNIRDYATINELICLANMESINSVLINDGIPQRERLIKLNQIAIQQMIVLQGDKNRYLLK